MSKILFWLHLTVRKDLVKTLFSLYIVPYTERIYSSYCVSITKLNILYGWGLSFPS